MLFALTYFKQVILSIMQSLETRFKWTNKVNYILFIIIFYIHFRLFAETFKNFSRTFLFEHLFTLRECSTSEGNTWQSADCLFTSVSGPENLQFFVSFREKKSFDCSESSSGSFSNESWSIWVNQVSEVKWRERLNGLPNMKRKMSMEKWMRRGTAAALLKIWKFLLFSTLNFHATREILKNRNH